MSRTKRLFSPALAVASVLYAGGTAWAQAPAAPATPPAPKAGSPAAQPAVKEAAKAKEEAPPAAKPAEPKPPEPKPVLSPLEEMVRGQRDDRWRRSRGNLRRSLEEAGFGDGALQDAVVDFAQEQDAAREGLRAAAARCSDALRDMDLPEAELVRLLERYGAEAAKAQQQREAALGKLDEKVGWKKKPRLQMLLRVKGLLGSEAWLAGDALTEADSFDLRVLYPAAQ